MIALKTCSAIDVTKDAGSMRFIAAIGGILVSVLPLVFFSVGAQIFLRPLERALVIAMTLETSALLLISIALLITPSVQRVQGVLLITTIATVAIIRCASLTQMRPGRVRFHPLRTLAACLQATTMLWWDWKKRQRLGLLAAMLTVAATPWLLLGWFPNEWGAFVGGTAFLAIPQIVAWLLFVGLWTGRMPVRGGAEERREGPTWFWIVAATYAALLLLLLWVILAVLLDLSMPPF